ncbi:MAG: replicative DNA helicase [Candidatus Paceibacterota bacterium]
MSNKSDLKDKAPPQNIEAEQSLLGSLMLDKNAITEVADMIEPRDFYKQKHKKIYKAMTHLFDKQEPIDVLSVANRLEEMSALDQVGGNSYLTKLVNKVPTAAHTSNYAKIVQRKRILRDLINASHEISELGHSEKDDIGTILDKAEEKVFNIAQKNLTQKFVSVSDSLEDAFERIGELSDSDETTQGVPTGFPALDNKLAGLQESDLILLGARPSLGKSTLALDFARQAAVEEDTAVGIFSLEMSAEQIIDRFIAAEANVNLWKLRTGRLSEKNDDFQRIQHALGNLSDAPIFIDDAATSTILQMKAMSRRLKARHNLGLIVVDYLQLVEPRDTSVSVVQQMTEISKSLKSLARELKVPVLALSQLSRAVEKRQKQVPKLADLRESGSLEQDADVVLFIHREDKYNPDTARENIADIIIAKHRNGPVGRVELYFDAPKVTFRSIDKSREEE